MSKHTEARYRIEQLERFQDRIIETMIKDIRNARKHGRIDTARILDERLKAFCETPVVRTRLK